MENYYIIFGFAIFFLILKLIGIFMHYIHNFELIKQQIIFCILLYSFVIIVFLFDYFKIEGLNREDLPVLFKFFSILLLIDGFISINILMGKHIINNKTTVNGKIIQFSSFNPLQKKNKNWTNEGTINDKHQTPEEFYNKLEQNLGIDIKTNSDFIKKNNDDEDWN